MILDYLTKDVCAFGVEINIAEEAIQKSVDLLYVAGKVTDRYIDDVLEGYRNYGPYIVLVPGFALPHAQPSGKVIEMGISFLQLLKPVTFGHETNDPVYYVMALAGTSPDNHLGLLQDLMEFLSCNQLVQQLPEVKNYDQLSQLISELL